VSTEESAIVVVGSYFRCFILFALKTELHLEPVLLKAKDIIWRLLLLRSVIDKVTFLSTSVKVLLDRTVPLNLSGLLMYKIIWCYRSYLLEVAFTGK